MGRGIVEKQQTLGWGESVVEMVSADLRRAFPQITGFSPRNVWDMKRFYLAYADEAIWRQAVAKVAGWAKADNTEILRQPVAEFDRGQNRLQPVANLTEEKAIEFLQQLVAEIPWGHNLLILNKITGCATRRFGWSLSVFLLPKSCANRLRQINRTLFSSPGFLTFRPQLYRQAAAICDIRNSIAY